MHFLKINYRQLFIAVILGLISIAVITRIYYSIDLMHESKIIIKVPKVNGELVELPDRILDDLRYEAQSKFTQNSILLKAIDNAKISKGGSIIAISFFYKKSEDVKSLERQAFLELNNMVDATFSNQVKIKSEIIKNKKDGPKKIILEKHEINLTPERELDTRPPLLALQVLSFLVACSVTLAISLRGKLFHGR